MKGNNIITGICIQVPKGGMMTMEKTNQELLDEIRQLRNELRHMQEIVNSLVNIVMEMEGDVDEYETLPSSQNYLDMYN